MGGFNVKKKAVSIICALLLFLTLGFPVHANGNDVQIDKVTEGIVAPQYEYISIIGSSLSISGNGYATCGGDILLVHDYDSVITITLQRSSDGNSWSNVRSWSESFSGSGFHVLEEGQYVVSGYIYRVVTTAIIKNKNTILETATCNSPEEHY